jgi:hypothetical protein
MNLAPKVRTEWKRYRETLPSADFLFPKWLLLQYDYTIVLCTSSTDYSG